MQAFDSCYDAQLAKGQSEEPCLHLVGVVLSKLKQCMRLSAHKGSPVSKTAPLSCNNWLDASMSKAPAQHMNVLA